MAIIVGTIANAIAETFVGIVSIIASILTDISVSNCRYYREKFVDIIVGIIVNILADPFRV